jgi:hypothetical protein
MLLRRTSILSALVSLIALSVGAALSAAAQDQAQANDEKSSLSESAKQAPDDTVGKTEIKLDRRTNPEYGNSAYSFRYKTQSKAKHKNYVDIVYSVNGNIRINNHGGMECGIVDIGSELDSGKVPKVKKADWQTRQIKPVTGHYYVYGVSAERNEMSVVFRVDQLSETQMGITAWYVKGKDRWPLSLAGRGAAGTSGMNISQPYAR